MSNPKPLTYLSPKNVDREGMRSFVIHSINHSLWTASNYVRARITGKSSPVAAAKKIFMSMYRDDILPLNDPVHFSIIELTKGGRKKNHIYEYVGKVSKLETPVERNIQGQTIVYQYEVDVTPVEKKGCSAPSE
jgi:hypothetical protein